MIDRLNWLNEQREKALSNSKKALATHEPDKYNYWTGVLVTLDAMLSQYDNRTTNIYYMRVMPRGYGNLEYQYKIEAKQLLEVLNENVVNGYYYIEDEGQYKYIYSSLGDLYGVYTTWEQLDEAIKFSLRVMNIIPAIVENPVENVEKE